MSWVWNIDTHTVVVDDVDATERSESLYTTSKQKTLAPARLGEDLADGCRVVEAIGFNDIPDLAELKLDALIGLSSSIVVQLL